MADPSRQSYESLIARCQELEAKLAAAQEKIHVSESLPEFEVSDPLQLTLERFSALRERTRLRLALEAAQADTWEWDLRTGTFTWPELQAHPGQESGDNSLEAWLSAVHPEDRGMARKSMIEAAERGADINFECRLSSANEPPRWVLIQGRPLRGADARPVSFIGIFVDITRRKSLEANGAVTREAAERHGTEVGTVIDAMHDPVIVYDTNGHPIRANKAVRIIYGFDPTTLSEKELADATAGLNIRTIQGDAIDVRNSAIQRALRGESVIGVQFILTDALGRDRVYSYSAVPLRLGNEIFGVVGYAYDITDRLLAEEEMRRSEELFRAVTENIPQLVWTASRSGRIEYLSDAWGKYLGKPLRATSAADWKKIISPEDYLRVIQAWRAAISSETKSGANYEIELRLQRANGDYDWHLARATRLANGRWFGTCTNIEHLKRSHEALMRSEKLASTGRMAATIAHEINNPLSAAINAIFLASADPSLAASTRELLNTADEELRRAAGITRQVLGFYRESSKQEPVDLSHVADAVLGLYARRISNKGISVSRSYRKVPPALAIPGELRQVVANLVANAIDATSQGGRLHVRTSRINGKVAITVADTGAGIAGENRSHIFEAFFTTKESIGTGLGLWVSNEIVKKHGGRIRLHSKLGKGTVFTVFLPVFRNGATPRRKAAGAE